MLRPQTWYLLGAALCIILCALIGAGTTVQLVLLIVAAAASVATVPLFKNRRVQAVCCLVPMALLLIWYVMLGVYFTAQELQWQHALPAVALLLLFMARKGIVHDEKVVRSYDRIR